MEIIIALAPVLIFVLGAVYVSVEKMRRSTAADSAKIQALLAEIRDKLGK